MTDDLAHLVCLQGNILRAQVLERVEALSAALAESMAARIAAEASAIERASALAAGAADTARATIEAGCAAMGLPATAMPVVLIRDHSHTLAEGRAKARRGASERIASIQRNAMTTVDRLRLAALRGLRRGDETAARTFLDQPPDIAALVPASLGL